MSKPTRKVRLLDIAYGRSGDKGDSVNIGIIARKPEDFQILKSYLTEERVKAHFQGLCYGKVTRYLLPNLHAMNFVLEKSLDGGGTISLRTDAQGKTYCAALLRMELEVS